jgi:hypothetical protein
MLCGWVDANANLNEEAGAAIREATTVELKLALSLGLASGASL